MTRTFMEYGGYLVVAVLVLAGISFVISIFYGKDSRSLKFTSFGFIILSALGLVFLGLDNSGNLNIAVLAFILISAIYYWLYRGILKNRNKN